MFESACELYVVEVLIKRSGFPVIDVEASIPHARNRNGGSRPDSWLVLPQYNSHFRRHFLRICTHCERVIRPSRNCSRALTRQAVTCEAGDSRVYAAVPTTNPRPPPSPRRNAVGPWPETPAATYPATAHNRPIGFCKSLCLPEKFGKNWLASSLNRFSHRSPPVGDFSITLRYCCNRCV